METRVAHNGAVHAISDRRIAHGGRVVQVTQVLQVQRRIKNPPSQTDPYENVWVLAESYTAPVGTPADPRISPPLIQQGEGEWMVAWTAATWGIETGYDVVVEWWSGGSDTVEQRAGHVSRTYDVDDPVTARLAYYDPVSQQYGPWVDAVGLADDGGGDTPPAKPVGAPSSVTVESDAPGSVSATWDNDGSTRTGIEIEWYSKPALEQTYSLLDDQMLASASTEAGHAVTAGDSAYCRLRYVNDGVVGDWSADSNEVIVPDSGGGGPDPGDPTDPPTRT